jgi:hypothetical protein
MGGRLLASIGFIVSPGMIFTMAGKVDYMSLQPGRPTPTVSSNAKASMNTTHKAIEPSGPDSMGRCRTALSRWRMLRSQEGTSK